MFCGNCGQALSDGVTLGDVIGADEEGIPDRGDLKLPIPGQIMKLVQLSITVSVSYTHLPLPTSDLV